MNGDSVRRIWRRVVGPKLRCRPGDVCLVIDQEVRYVPETGEAFLAPHRLGLIVEVVLHDGEVWSIKEPIANTQQLQSGRLTTAIVGIADDMLQPLPRDRRDLDAELEAASTQPMVAGRRPQTQEV